jgi:hypothetical protein
MLTLLIPTESGWDGPEEYADGGDDDGPPFAEETNNGENI